MRIPDEILIACAAGELDASQTDEVEEHLKNSPTAAARVAQFRAVIATMLEDDTVAPAEETLARAKRIFQADAIAAGQDGWWTRLERFVADLIFDSRTQPALAGFRGVAQETRLSFESSIANIDLEATPMGKGDALKWAVMGQVTTHGPAGQIDVAFGRTDAEIEMPLETTADVHGMFELEVDSGAYDVLVRIDDRIVVLKPVALHG